MQFDVPDINALSSKKTTTKNSVSSRLKGIASFQSMIIPACPLKTTLNTPLKTQTEQDSAKKSEKKSDSDASQNNLSQNNPSQNNAKAESRQIGWLLVRVTMEPNFHLYSMNPIEGSFPTKIEVKISNSGTALSEVQGITLGKFIPASTIKFSKVMGQSLEIMKDQIDWLAPIEGASARLMTRDEQVKLLEKLKITGTFIALSCIDGEGGTCNRIEHRFTSNLDPSIDIEPLLAQTKVVNAAIKEHLAQEASEKVSSVVDNTDTANTSGSVSATASSTASESASSFSIWTLFSAFFGGLLLNVMPCVLPVIGLKIVSFFHQAGQSRSRALWLNGWYTLGILSVFLILAFMSVGLSYLFTYGLFQIIMGAIVFAMALNLMGIWEIHLPSFLGGRKSNELMEKEGSVGAYFKGIITTLLAIPCGAPLLSPALVWADSMIKQNQMLLVIFVYLVIGLGMACPYLLLGAFPEMLRFMPKPGLWMETFRNIMGYVLLAAVVWILFSMPLVLVVPMICCLFALWFACWYLGRIPWDASSNIRIRTWSISLVILTIAVLVSFNIKGFDNPYTLENAMEHKMVRWAIRAEREGLLRQDFWSLFETDRYNKLLVEGKPVIIDFTADWCMNCKALESTILHTEETKRLLEQKGITSMTADMTNQNDTSEEMTLLNRLLDEHGGRQVPTIMIFNSKKNSEPVILRGLFTKQTFLEALEQE